MEENLTQLFLNELSEQAIYSLEDLFECITDKEQIILVNTICSKEFKKIYLKEKGLKSFNGIK